MGFPVVVSDSIKRRIGLFHRERFDAFQRAVADVVKGRATGQKVHTSFDGQREFYALASQGYTLYYSRNPRDPQNLVFEEFLTEDEGELILDLFSGSN